MQQIGEEPYSSNPLLPYEERGREGGQHQLLVVWPVVVELDFNVLSTIQGHLRTDSWIQHSIRQTMHDLPPAVHTRQGLRNIWSGAWRDLDTNPSSQNRPRPEAHRERERGGGGGGGGLQITTAEFYQRHQRQPMFALSCQAHIDVWSPIPVSIMSGAPSAGRSEVTSPGLWRVTIWISSTERRRVFSGQYFELVLYIVLCSRPYDSICCPQCSFSHSQSITARSV